jgi:hypothetical protein
MLAAIRRASSRSGPRPLLQHPRALSDCQPDARPMFDSAGEDFAGPTKTVAGIEQAIDFRPIPRPFLDLVEVAVAAYVALSVTSWKSTSWGFGSLGMAKA